MSDLGSFEVQSEALRTEGDEWAARADQLRAARDLVTQGSGQGYNFGAAGILAHLDQAHNDYIETVLTALSDGVQTFTFMRAALHSAANAYDGADETSAVSSAKLKKRLG